MGRYVLSYKGLPFEIDWVELPDIAPRMKEIGARTTVYLDGSDLYTLPVLRDPNTGAVVTDSYDIAVYLDNTYPEKPVFPKDTNGLICALEPAYIAQMLHAYKFLVVRDVEMLRDCSAEYYATTRGRLFNRKFAEFSPEGPERDQHWAALEKVFTTAKIWYDKTNGKWLMGGTFSYADIVIASFLFWFKTTLHDDEWEKVAAWHDGQWSTLLVDVESECKVR